MSDEVTRVVFRKWRESDGGDVIALFTDEAAQWSDGYVSSFMHVGQHGAAHYEGVLSRTTLATPAEYAALVAELESPPCRYRLKIRKRR